MNASASNTQAGGVDRSHGHSTLEKSLFFGLHTLALALSADLVFEGWITRQLTTAGLPLELTDPLRARLCLAIAGLYWARHALTLFYLLQCKVGMGEAVGLGLFLIVQDVGFCAVAGGITRDTAITWRPIDWLALLLVALGSYLNSASELQRKRWKRHPDHAGHCFTGGLFRWSMHINYFGDVVSFTGWALVLAWWWALTLPLMMLSAFIFYHIPALDEYLEHRYGDEFRSYAQKTRKLIPFVY